MSSKTSAVPVVSPPPSRPSQVVSVTSPTCVGRSLDFCKSTTTATAANYQAHDEKENSKVAATVITINNNKNKATVIPASPPHAKKTKTEEATESKPKYKIDKYSVEE